MLVASKAARVPMMLASLDPCSAKSWPGIRAYVPGRILGGCSDRRVGKWLSEGLAGSWRQPIGDSRPDHVEIGDAALAVNTNRALGRQRYPKLQEVKIHLDAEKPRERMTAYRAAQSGEACQPTRAVECPARGLWGERRGGACEPSVCCLGQRRFEPPQLVQHAAGPILPRS